MQFGPGNAKTYTVKPSDSTICAACHLSASNPERDWTMFSALMFTKDQYKFVAPPGPNEVVVSSIAFAPANLTVKVGTTIKWRFDDVTNHQLLADNGAFATGTRASPGEFSFTFDKPGTYTYFCTIHPEQMRGKIEVTQ